MHLSSIVLLNDVVHISLPLHPYGHLIQLCIDNFWTSVASVRFFIGHFARLPLKKTVNPFSQPFDCL